MSAVFSFYDFEDVEIGSSNKISFGQIQVGTISSTISIWVWNDRDDLIGGDESLNPQVFAIKEGDDDLDILFTGNELNGYKSMLEARSCGAKNAVSDNQSDWTPIGPMSYLRVGKMPANSARLIELRVNAPHDAELFDLSSFTVRMSG